MNIKLKLTYQGTHILGWQKTNAGRSVEEELEKALLTLLQEEVKLQAASRTDAGVHAHGQIVNFKTAKSLPLFKLKASLNGLLPKDIAVLEAEEMADTFHPTLDCKTKTYHYDICLGPVQLPHFRCFSWHVYQPIDLDKVALATSFLKGNHDFSAFCNVKTTEIYKDKVRHVSDIQLINLPYHRVRIIVKGSNFLYRMVRIIVGTSIHIGIGKIELDELESILKGKDRTQAGITAPAHGLSLFSIEY